MIHLDTLNSYYHDKFEVESLKFTEDVWPQFAYDLLMHHKLGVIQVKDLQEIRAVANLYKEWISGHKPSAQQWNSYANDITHEATYAATYEEYIYARVAVYASYAAVDPHFASHTASYAATAAAYTVSPSVDNNLDIVNHKVALQL